MDKKKKFLAILAICMASVLLFCFCSFAEVNSSFSGPDSNGYYTLSSTLNNVPVGSFPDKIKFLPPNSSNSYGLKVFNDSSRTFTFTLYPYWNNARSDIPCKYYLYETGSSSGSYTNVSDRTTVTLTLEPGYTLEIDLMYRSYTNTISGATNYETARATITITPDPQYIPSPVEVLLSSVSDFVDSFFTQASAIVTLIVSSWVFLVPVTMMLVVFFVMAVRKIVKGV